MAIEQSITDITALPDLLSSERPDAVDNLVEVELPRFTEEIGTWQDELNSTEQNVNTKSANVDNKNANVNTKAQQVEEDAASAEAAKNQILDYVIPTEATYDKDTIDDKNKVQDRYNSNAYGYTKRLKVEDRFESTDTPNTLIDKSSEPIRFSDGLVERLGEKKSQLQTFDASNTSLDITAHGLTAGTYVNVYIGEILQYTDKITIAYSNNIVFGTSRERKAEVYTVREVQTVELPEAPFTPTSNDELLDDKLNGLICQQSHDKDDIVVSGVELATATTASADTGWSATSDTVVVNNDITSLTYINGVVDSLIAGKEYVLAFSLSGYSGSDNMGFSGEGGVSANARLDSDGDYTEVFTSDGNQLNIFSRATNTGTITFSVKLKDTKYQATRDTSEMYDYDDTAGTISVISNETVVYCTGANPNGTVGHFYKYINTTGIANISTTNLDGLPTYWQDLGTASNMSLENPYFQKLDQVTTQDVILARYNKTTKVADYHTFRGTKCFGAKYSQYDVMSAYGYSQVDKNLWEDADYEYVFIGLIPRLNAGGYHPIYNPLGTNNWNSSSSTLADGVTWDNTALQPSSLLECFNQVSMADNVTVGITAFGNVASTISGRPEDDSNQFYDKIYLEGLNGIAPSGGRLPYAGKMSKRDLLEEEANWLLNGSGLEEGVVTEYIRTDTVASDAYSATNGTYINLTKDLSDLPAIDNESTYKVFISGVGLFYPYIINNGSTDYIYLTKNEDYSVDTTNYTASIAGGEDVYIWVTKKQPYLLTYKSYTNLDIIADPDDYPSDWKAHLLSGKGIVGNALLVGQDGTDYIPDGTTKKPILSKKFIAMFDKAITSSDNGSTWVNSGVDNTTNSIENTILEASYGTGGIWLIPYKSANTPLTQNDPQNVLSVLDKVFASNSHNNLMVYAGTGKVAVGNGSNGLESKVLENVILGANHLASTTALTTFKQFDVILFDLPTSTSGVNGVYYQRIADDAGVFPNSTNYLDETKYKEFGGTVIATTPSHNSLSLDNSDSSACKWFVVLTQDETGEYLIQVATVEGVYDVSGYKWDTGIGLLFEQLINGTLTDINGNTVQTKILTFRTGVFE